MAVYKVTYIFNAGRQGWTETWYKTANTMPAARDFAVKLIPTRAAMLAIGVTLEAIRISNEAKKGDADLIHVAANQGQSAFSRDILPHSVLLRFRDQEGLYQRPLYLRGFPDEWVDFPLGGWRMADTFKAKADAYIAAVIAAGAEFKVLDKDAPYNLPVNVAALVEGEDGWTRVSAPPDEPAATHVLLSGWTTTGDQEDLCYIKGTKEIISHGVGGPDIKVRWDRFRQPALLIPGVLRWQKYKTAIVDIGNYVRGVTRDTGRAFFVPRGRQPKRC